MTVKRILPVPRGETATESNEIATAGLYPVPTSQFEMRIYHKCVELIKNLQKEYDTPEKLRDFKGFPPLTFMAGELLYNQKRKVSGRDLIRIKTSCKNLIQSYFSKYISPKKFKYYSVFSFIEYDTGLITFQLNNDMLFDLLDLEKQFSIRSSAEFNKLKSIHAQLLYRGLLTQAAFRPDFSFSLPELHNMLCATKAYTEPNGYGQFKRMVIIPAVAEIKEKIPDFKYLTFEEVKCSRKVTSLHFHLYGDKYLLTQDAKKEKNVIRDYQKESIECFNKHSIAGKKCNPRNCKRCQFCFSRGRFCAVENKPSWVKKASE